MYPLSTYPNSGLALCLSGPLTQARVALDSVKFSTLGVPGDVGNVLGSGDRCKVVE